MPSTCVIVGFTIVQQRLESERDCWDHAIKGRNINRFKAASQYRTDIQVVGSSTSTPVFSCWCWFSAVQITQRTCIERAWVHCASGQAPTGCMHQNQHPHDGPASNTLVLRGINDQWVSRSAAGIRLHALVSDRPVRLHKLPVRSQLPTPAVSWAATAYGRSVFTR